MANLLLRLFVADRENTDDPSVRSAYGRLAGIVGIICNILLFISKLVIGTISGAVSITADAINNLTDASSSLVTLVGFRLAEMPADKDHPYGHARMEYISGLTVAAMILLIGVELAKSSIEKILHPTPVEFSAALVIVLALSILIKLWLALFNRKLGNAINSTTLQATATDSRNDAISTTAVLGAAILQVCTSWNVDGAVGLAVAAFILWSGVGVAKDTINLLLGTGADPQLQKDLAQEILSHEKVLGIHDLMVHDYGPGRRFATAHVEMDTREDPMLCHDIIDNIERLCQEKFNIQLCIHYDPVIIDDPQLNETKELVTAYVQSIDNRLSLHDFRMVVGPTHTNLIFDMAIPFGYPLTHQELKEKIDRAVKANHPNYYTVITFDEVAFSNGSCS